jgi:hypothetical protein
MRFGDISRCHRRTQLPRDNTTREVIKDGREIEPPSANDLDMLLCCLVIVGTLAP